MQEDCNAVVYRAGQDVAIWATNKGEQASRGPCYFMQQADGNLVLYDRDNLPLWESEGYSQGGRNPFRLDMQSDGNLVTYDPDRAIWASDTVQDGKPCSEVGC